MAKWQAILKAGLDLKEVMDTIAGVEIPDFDRSVNAEIRRENQRYLMGDGETEIKSVRANILGDNVMVQAIMVDGYYLPIMELQIKSDEHLNKIADMLGDFGYIEGVEELYSPKISDYNYDALDDGP